MAEPQTTQAATLPQPATIQNVFTATPTPATNPGRVVLSFTPPGPNYAISETAEMPVIKATATLENVTPSGNEALEFSWSATVKFKGDGCPHGMGVTTEHTPIQAKTATGEWTIPFTEIRGGTLAVTVSVSVANQILSASANNLSIAGTNPSSTTLATVTYPHEIFKKLMRLESSLKQFRGAGATSMCPLFSADNLKGVGLCQVTPAPSADAIWNWKANVDAGIAVWKEKERNARAFVQQQQQGQRIKDLVTSFNNRRQQQGQRQLTITLPDYADEQLANDTLRGYNGYSGNLHEYRIATDADGYLIVTINTDGTDGTAEWHQNTAAERKAHYTAINLDPKRWGDPNYVEDVLGQASF